jgi:hypothetical protein
MDPYPTIGIHENHMEMTKFGGKDNAGYIKVLGELKRYVEGTQNIKKAPVNPEAASNNEPKANNPSPPGAIVFNGPITGHNVISGMNNASGANTTFNFN